MRKRTYIFVAGGLALSILLAVVVTLGLVTGGDSRATDGGDPIAALAIESGGTTEGINVEGAWTIEVQEPDGRFVSRVEFENALTPIGATALLGVLAKNTTAGSWVIRLKGPVGSGPCDSGLDCNIVEAETSGAIRYFPNLTVTVVPGGINAPDALRLSGSAVVQNDSQIDTVQTRLDYCWPNTTPATCTSTFNGGPLFFALPAGRTTITEANIVPIPVVVGQQVLVSVDITLN